MQIKFYFSYVKSIEQTQKYVIIILERVNDMEDKTMIKIINEEGKEVEVEVVQYFTLESTGKDYIVYTEGETDEAGDVLVYTSEVVEHDDEIELKGIEDPKVLEEVVEYLTNIVQAEE